MIGALRLGGFHITIASYLATSIHYLCVARCLLINRLDACPSNLCRLMAAELQEASAHRLLLRLSLG